MTVVQVKINDLSIGSELSPVPSLFDSYFNNSDFVLVSQKKKQQQHNLQLYFAKNSIIGQVIPAQNAFLKLNCLKFCNFFLI